MSSKSSSLNPYTPSDNFANMAIKNFAWGTTGLILGVIVNNIVIYLSNHLKIKYLIVQNVIQLILCSILLALMHSYHNYFGWTWQNLTPGLFFVSFFFGVQYKILSNIQNTFILNEIKLL